MKKKKFKRKGVLEVDDLVQHFKARREAILIFLGCKISQRKRSKRERKRK